LRVDRGLDSSAIEDSHRGEAVSRQQTVLSAIPVIESLRDRLAKPRTVVPWRTASNIPPRGVATGGCSNRSIALLFAAGPRCM